MPLCHNNNGSHISRLSRRSTEKRINYAKQRWVWRLRKQKFQRSPPPPPVCAFAEKQATFPGGHRVPLQCIQFAACCGHLGRYQQCTIANYLSAWNAGEKMFLGFWIEYSSCHALGNGKAGNTAQHSEYSTTWQCSHTNSPTMCLPERCQL